MSEKQDEFQLLAELLLLEKKEDFDQYKRMVQQLPVKERKEKGLSWYPVQVMKSGYTFGDRAFVVITRADGDDRPHRFSAGKLVNLFTQQAGAYKPERSGVINYVDKNKMKVILNSKDLPEWLKEGSVGVDLLFDERTYLEMNKALKLVREAKGNRLAELRDIITGKLSAGFHPVDIPIKIPHLNDSQNAAVGQIISAQDLALVHGPPGTGKTTTLVAAIRELCKTENTVLVTAPSNTAVDVLTERLAAVDLNVVRLGNISRVDDNIIVHTLESMMSKHPDSKHIKKVKIQAAEARRMANQYKRNFGQQERVERQNMRKEARELHAWAKQLEDRLLEQLLDGANVITCTLVGAAHPILQNRHFRTVVIDEAAQALEAANWIPILKASKVVMTGDPFQLPPTVKSKDAQKGGLAISLLEKCLKRKLPSNFLRTQYRMHERIMGFSNQQFYDNQLRADITVAQHSLDIEDKAPLVFIDTAGCGFEETINSKTKSRYNSGEYNILREHLYQLVAQLDTDNFPSLAIISPYKEQVMYIKEAIREDETLSGLDIQTGTIDGFQGQERDIIYLSLVRSNNKSEIGFLKDYRRMNVAMTRARKKLIMIGDSATVGADSFYAAFLDYCEKMDMYKSAWEYMQ